MQSGILERRGYLVAGVLGAGLCLAGLRPAVAATSAGGGAALPASLRAPLYRALIAQPAKAPPAANACVSSRGPGLSACFGRHGVRFKRPDAQQALSLRLVAFGRRGDKLAPVGGAKPVVARGRVNYRYAGVTEWWRVLPTGYEQGFTFARRPAGTGELVLGIRANRAARQYGADLGWGRIRYGGLAVLDARGRRLPARIETQGSRIAIIVNDRRATYPITVDPLVWILQQVNAPSASSAPASSSAPAPSSASPPATTVGAFGASVALAGGTAFVGAPYSTVGGKTQRGSVYLFSEASDRTWSQSGMLTASDGAAYDQFGSELAVSGTALIVGAPGATVNGHAAQGAVYVFDESGGSWNEQQKLTASDGAAGDEFGSAVAIAGTSALVGARYAKIGANARQGAVYAFAAASAGWAETQKFTASDGAAGDLFGSAVALDGASAIVGASGASMGGDSLRGAAYVFSQAGGAWNQVEKLTAGDGAAGDLFGSAVALEDTAALVGAPGARGSDGVNQGAVYAFDESGGAWSQAAKLTASDGARGDAFGTAISLVGGEALIGTAGPSGNAYLFGHAGGEWAQTMDFPGGAAAGRSVAFGDRTALVGAPNMGISGSGGGYVTFYGQTDLALVLNATASLKQGQTLSADTILTNNDATVSPPLSLAVSAPSGASYISASATQGTCSYDTILLCNLGALAGNGGNASVNAKYKIANAKPATTVTSSAQVIGALPSLQTSADTRIEGQPSSGGGGGFAFGGLALLGLLMLAERLRRR